MCDKAVNKYLFEFNCIPDQYKTQEMCKTVVSNDRSLIAYCPDKYITQKMCDDTVDEDPFLIVYCPDITQKMRDQAVHYSLAVLLISGFFAFFWLIV